MKKTKLDIVMIWRCFNCKSYQINFICDRLFCRNCGKLMKKVIYKENRSLIEND